MEPNVKHEKEHENHEHGTVTVYVNDRPIHFKAQHTNGTQIKKTAIEQGVEIQQDFLLELKITDTETRIVEDHEEMHLIEDMHFIAIAREIIVSVNEQPVKFHVRIATGMQIKMTAIEQGVLIQQNFVLQEELPNGTSRIVGDAPCSIMALHGSVDNNKRRKLCLHHR